MEAERFNDDRFSQRAQSNNCYDITLRYGLSEQKHVMPRIMLRCPVFAPCEFRGANAKRRPVYYKPTLLGIWGKKTKVYQTAGEQLNQASEDVFIELVKMALRLEFQPAQRVIVTFHVNDLLRSTGRNLGSKNRLLLAAELNRLKRASFRFENDDWIWEAGLITDIVQMKGINSKTGGYYQVEMNAKMAEVFKTGFSYIDTEVKEKFRAIGDYLGMWLYEFYETHSRPYAFREERLKLQAGRTLMLDSDGSQIRGEQQRSKWLSELTKSLANLQKFTGWECCLKKEVKNKKENLKVYVTKPTKAPTSKPLLDVKAGSSQFKDYEDDI